MTEKELTQTIRELQYQRRITLGEIEDAVKMPRNCLSGMLNGKRKFPARWQKILEAYIETTLKKDEKQPLVEKAKTSKAVTPDKEMPAAPPKGLTKSQQLRWYREQNQTLQ